MCADTLMAGVKSNIYNQTAVNGDIYRQIQSHSGDQRDSRFADQQIRQGKNKFLRVNKR